MKNSGTFTSCTNTHLYYDLYVPQIFIRPRGIVQIHHGLGEYRDRYINFAKFLRQEGYIVVIIDFPGHGTSLYQFEQGYFGEGMIQDTLVKDIHHVLMTTKEAYPDLPYFIIGNQFSTLVVRQYLSLYGEFVEGAILISPGHFHDYKTFCRYVKISEMLKGNMYRSKRVKRILDYQFNQELQGESNTANYLTGDKEELDAYLEDPMTNFVYTNKAYHQIIQLSKLVNSASYFQNVIHDVSIYFISGKFDHFGKEGKVAKQLFEKYKKAGVIDVDFRTFDSKKQDLLHEVNKSEVYENILAWLNARTFM